MNINSGLKNDVTGHINYDVIKQKWIWNKLKLG